MCLFGYFSEKSSPKKGLAKFALSKPAFIFAQNLTNPKTSTMKKVIALLAIAGFVACNSGDTKTAAADTTKPAVDTTKKMDTAKAAMDTTKKDTAKMKM